MNYLPKLKQINDKYRMFHAMTPDTESDAKFLFSAKDNLTSMDMETCAGSRILGGYRPAFDATAIAKLRDAGGKLIGKTNMDEFGFGTFSTNSGWEIPRNPHDLERACGGSSGGSACAASALEGHVSLGVSTGGSICCPASFCGVYGIAPTYGRVSRYGLIDYGNSLDKIGVLSSDACDLRKYMDVIKGKDPKDPTSCVQPDGWGKASLKSVAVPKEGIEGLSKDVESAFRKFADEMVRMGVDVDYVDMPSLKYAMPAYYVLATSEASTNLARYVGMRYGQQEGDLSLKFDDYFSSFRSKYFGDEAKRRILLGTFTRMAGYSDRYYAKARQVRNVVINDYKRVLADHDAVLAPTMPFTAPRFDEISKMSALDSYKADYLTVPANLAGTPHMSLPCGYDPNGMPVGMQFVADHWNEGVLFDIAERWQREFEIKRPEVSV